MSRPCGHRVGGCAVRPAYTAAVSSATGDDIKIGSTTTRVSDFVNRDTEFDDLMRIPAAAGGVLPSYRAALQTQFAARSAGCRNVATMSV